MNHGYARVSTGEQNLDLQLDALERAGCDVIHQEKVSGKAGANRTIQDAVLRELQPGDTFTVWRLDRLGRYSFMDIYNDVKRLHDRGITFKSTTESIDLSNPYGEIVLVLMAWFAELERNIIIARTKAGKQARRDRGLHVGGPRTYGFELDRKTLIEREAARLLEAAKHVLDGKALARLVDDWNAEGVETKSGDGTWNETTLKRMLLNDGLVPAILTSEQHHDLVDLFSNPQARQRMGPPAVHLLSGILKCGLCDAPMYVAQIRDRDGSKHEVYRCAKAVGGRPSGCGKVSIRVDTVERWMADAVKEAVCGERFTEIKNALRAAVLEGASAEQLDAWKSELDDSRMVPTRYRTSELEARETELQRLIAEATVRLSAAPELRELESLPRTREAFEKAWAGWDVPTRRRRIKLLLSKVVVKPTGKGVRFHPSRLDPDWRY